MPKIIIACVALVALVAYGMMSWQSSAAQKRKLVAANIDYFCEESPLMGCAYDEVDVEGYPFASDPVIRDFVVTYNAQGAENFEVRFGDVLMETRDEAQQRYLLRPIGDAIYVNQADGNQYSVEVSPYPTLSVRVAEKPSDSYRFSEFAVGIPSEVMLTITREDGQMRKVAFRQQAIEVALWRKIPAQPEQSLSLFSMMLDEAFLAPAQ